MISRRTLKRIRAPFRRVRGIAAMAVGRAASAKPLSRDFGYSRGTPIDRFYVERFLDEHRRDIRGRVLEIGDDAYSRRFGGDHISRQDILHVRSGEANATIVGDLTAPGVLPVDSFDCIILTQTLHLLFDLPAAVRNLQRSLRAGGVVLITTPGISPIPDGEWRQSWCWSLTEHSLRQLLNLSFGDDDVQVASHGNLLAATAFLHGAAVEEVGRSRLSRNDPSYPLIVTGRAVRPI